MTTRGFAVLATVALVFIIVATPAMAEKGDKQIQFGAMYSTPTNDLMELGATIEADAAAGFQASFEFLVADKIGVEPALTRATHDIDVMEPGFPTLQLGDADLTTLTVNLNFHLTPESNFDIFAGPTLGYTFWGDLESALLSESFPIEDDFIFGVNFGIGVPFGESDWSFVGAVNWIVVEAALENADPGEAPLDVDPLQVKVGVARRF